EEEHDHNRKEADRISGELTDFLERMRRLRGKTYAILSNASALQADQRLQADLDDALSDVQTLEEAMSEAVEESQFLS
ncbi:MAG TPA: hypothetical protein VK092_07205, partial [Deinococcales bacterium]|nr:hypothetical protein [Deinococcales bacterium]